MHIDEYRGNDGYTDANGIWWEDALSFYHSGVMGFCGCGDPEMTMRYVLKVLLHIDYRKAKLNHLSDLEWIKANVEYNKVGLELFGSDEAEWFMKYVLDNKGLSEHGCSVNSAWLTQRGREMMEDLTEIFGNIDKENI